MVSQKNSLNELVLKGNVKESSEDKEKGSGKMEK